MRRAAGGATIALCVATSTGCNPHQEAAGCDDRRLDTSSRVTLLTTVR